jgi:Fur family transcriptional regulator, ferric uptake regulator
MNINKAKELLVKYDLRLTESRLSVLKIFMRKSYAMTLQDIEKVLNNDSDRVTVYRTLKTFIKSGLIHKVLDDEGNMKYALCSESCSEEKHDHDHLHFKCMKCEQTSCIEDIKIPQISMPSGYVLLKSNILIQGICRGCNI